MWQTTYNRTFKEIDKYHTLICIENVDAIIIVPDMDSYIVRFWINGIRYDSDYFSIEEEAIKFRDEIMGWEEK